MTISNYLASFSSFSSRALLMICVWLIAKQGFSQQRLFTNQQHFGVEEGLPQSYISGILQDDDGFIWLSTLDGFSRYDGRGFKTIRYNFKDKTGLSANSINNLARQVNNTVTLFYSQSQADDFNLRNFKVTPNKNLEKLAGIPGADWQTHHVGYNTANWFFILKNNKGAGWLNNATGKIRYANKANGLLKDDRVNAIVESAEGKIYMLNEDGVQVSDTAQQYFKWTPFKTHIYPEQPGKNGELFAQRFSMVCLPGNRLAIEAKDQIILLDVDKRTSKIIQAPAPTPGSVSSPGSLQVDGGGNVYFENYGRIFRMDGDGNLKLLWENTGPALRMTAYFIDRSDVLWVSINAQGLLKIDLNALHFESYRYSNNFVCDIMQRTLPTGGLPLPLGWKDIQASYFFRQAKDSRGNLFVSANWNNHQQIFQLTTTGLRPLPHLPGRSVYSALVIMPGDEIWAYDQIAAAWYRWKSFDALPERFVPYGNNIKSVEMADGRYIEGFLWLSTYNHGLLQYKGLQLINQFAGTLASGTMPKTLTEICPDPLDKNKFWIGSRGGGLILWDVQKGLERIYTEQDGLPNNTIYCILPDSEGKIWCSTNKGIFKFDRITNRVTSFEKTDGLPGNEFNRAHKYLLADGRLAFGGLDGYTIFDPADFTILNKTRQVPVVLTGLQINNIAQDVAQGKSLITEPLSSLSVLNLPYNKNYLRFEFAALLYNQPQKIKYRFQLEGVDKNWVENGNSNVAAYAALRPGNYTFRINATDDYGLWSDNINQIKIIIQPPFWATWWAWLIYAAMALVLLRWYIKMREKRIETERNVAYGKREAMRLREVDELKDRFFSNITHEFRTPLTLIMTPLEKLAKDASLSSAAISTVKTAQRNSKQLLRLINEFLDFSKLNDGQLKVKLTTGEPAVFTAACVSAFNEAAIEKNISLSFSQHQAEGYYFFDEEKWEKIISNLLSNALKFTPANGAVSVQLSAQENDLFLLKITDNGPGIPENEQEKIFERFYQVDGSTVRNYAGTGIGLSLVKELTELMGGTLKLQSEQGNTNFTISLPLKKMVKVLPAETVAPPGKVIKDMHDAATPLLLIAEDNDELRSFLVDTMRTHYRVLEANNGDDGWNMILEELPDLVISDVMMPGKDGFTLCQLCKEDKRTAHIGFILLTSKAAHEARITGLGHGADDYISKPFSLPELELRTSNLLHLQQQQRAWLQSQWAHTAPADPLPEVTDPFLIEIYEQMDKKLDDAEMGIDYLCKVMAMSRSTLNRKLKSLLNISTNDFIRQYRLQKAANLIYAGTDISSAAYQVGFSSPSYFSQCFKEKYGLTPSDWVSRQN